MNTNPIGLGRCVAFLRGLNVGGHRVTNDELAAAFAVADLPEAQPYQASGNVVFDLFDDRTTGRLETQIADTLEQALGYAVPTLIRTSEEVATLAHASPFPPSAVEQTEGRMQVLLLASNPTSAIQRDVEELCPDSDHVHFVDRAMLWLPPETTSTSSFDIGLVERTLGVTTMRTQGTLQRITKRFLSPPG